MNTNNIPQQNISDYFISILNEYKYDLTFLNIDFEKLITDYQSLETKIRNDLDTTFLGIVQFWGGHISGSTIEIQDDTYTYHSEFNLYNRTLTLCLIPTLETHQQVHSELITVDHFGLIRFINVLLPDRVNQLQAKFCEILQKQVVHAYTCLEESYINGSRVISEKLVTNLYEILDNYLVRDNKDQLRGKYWYTITAAKDQLFRFVFREDTLRAIIQQLKQRQFPDFSPFEAVSCLLLKDGLDEGAKRFLEDQIDADFLQVSTMVKKQEDAPMWRSQASLLNDTASAYQYISRRNNYLLCVFCPEKVSSLFLNTVEKAKPDLEAQFINNVQSLSFFVKTMGRIGRPVEKSNVYNEVKEIVTSVIAKSLVEWFKNPL